MDNTPVLSHYGEEPIHTCGKKTGCLFSTNQFISSNPYLLMFWDFIAPFLQSSFVHWFTFFLYKTINSYPRDIGKKINKLYHSAIWLMILKAISTEWSKLPKFKRETSHSAGYRIRAFSSRWPHLDKRLLAMNVERNFSAWTCKSTPKSGVFVRIIMDLSSLFKNYYRIESGSFWSEYSPAFSRYILGWICAFAYKSS